MSTIVYGLVWTQNEDTTGTVFRRSQELLEDWIQRHPERRVVAAFRIDPVTFENKILHL